MKDEGRRTKYRFLLLSYFVLRTSYFPSYFPLHVGPGGLAAAPRRTEEQTERPATLGGKLQAAKIAPIKPIAGRPNSPDARTPQCLIERPEGIGIAVRPQHEHLRKIDSPGGGSRRIEVA